MICSEQLSTVGTIRDRSPRKVHFVDEGNQSPIDQVRMLLSFLKMMDRRFIPIILTMK